MMIEFSILFKVICVFLLALLSPGPDFMIVSSMSLTRGRADGMKAAAGIASVIALYTTISLTGLSALIGHYWWMALAIKICGGFYLLYLGFIMWRSSLSVQAPPPVQTLVTGTPRQRNAYWAGALTSLTNPKAVAFFASIFAIALTPDTHLLTKMVIGVAIPSITFLWFSFVAFGLSKPRVRHRYQRWQHVIDRVTGTVLGFFGLKLILSSRS